MTKLGTLKIPKIEPITTVRVHGIIERLYSHYAPFLHQDWAKDLLDVLANDPRVKAFDGQSRSRGHASSHLDVNSLLFWYIWATNEYGKEVANTNLDKFLDAELVQLINTVWILGIKVDRTIDLGKGYSIVPIEEMPLSTHKEEYARDLDRVTGFTTSKPQAALTCLCDINKIAEGANGPGGNKYNQSFWDKSLFMRDAAFLFSVLPNVSCAPYFATSYDPPDMPMGVWGGSGGHLPDHDVLSRGNRRIDDTAIDEFKSHFSRLHDMPNTERSRIALILSRLSQAKCRRRVEDQILDLGIALEMALLNDNDNHHQLSLSFKLRGSWLLGDSPEKRKEVFDLLGKIYKYRSQVAHSGTLCKNNEKKKRQIQEEVPVYLEVLQRVLKSLIQHGKPDWTKLILNM